MRKVLGFLIGVLLVAVTAAAMGQTAPALTFTASPLTGSCPLTVTLNWNATGVTTCSKLDGWTGVAALSGSQVVTVSGATTYTLQCQAGSGEVNLSWTPATQNVDGTAYTNAAGYELYQAPTAAGVPTATPTTLPNGSSATLTNVPAGPRYFGLKSKSTTGATSAMSGLANTNVLVASITKSVTPTCSVPNPPTGLTATSTLAYVIGPYGGINKLAGTIALGTPCGAFVKLKNGKRYYEIARSAIDLRDGYNPPLSTRFAAVCA